MIVNPALCLEVMKKFKKRKKIILTLGIVLVLPITALGLDIIFSGSVYHPLTYVYSGLSWGICKYFGCYPVKQKPSTPLPHNAFAVVTSQRNATEVGLRILDKGGNAVDAAVAVGYALAVTDPCCGNIGGGGFMLLRNVNGSATFIN